MRARLLPLTVICACHIGVGHPNTDKGSGADDSATSVLDTDSDVDTDTDTDTDTDVDSDTDSDTGSMDDLDGDGQTVEQGDCADTDASQYRGAPDADGDGVDSNCDGIDSSRFVLAEDIASARMSGDLVDDWPDNPGNNAGFVVTMTDDATGDGLPDIYVGGPSYFYDPEGEGRPQPAVWLVPGLSFGEPPLNEAATTTWRVPEADGINDFGTVLEAAGDIDADGLSDVVVGADLAYSDSWSGGLAAVYSSGTGGDRSFDDFLFAVHGSDGDLWVGAVVVGNVDTNADGALDVISFVQNSSGSSETLIFTDPPLGLVPSEAADVRLMAAVQPSSSSERDANGDGYDDLWVWEGGELVMAQGPFNSAEAPARLFTVLPPEGGNHSYSFGDINGDGAVDLAYGAAGETSAGTNSGRVGIFFGPLEGMREFDHADAFLDAERSGVGLSRGLSITGDLDGDGDDEIVVGAPGVYVNRLGAVAIFWDPWVGTVTTASADVVIDGGTLWDCFGWSITTSGDVDGDGRDDVVVGAPYDMQWAGSVWIFPAANLVDLIP